MALHSPTDSHFNLSHSADLALIAIAAASSVGVDLEYIPAQSDYAEIARRFFSAAEVDHLSALPSHLYAEAFFSCWTKKEAYVRPFYERHGYSVFGTLADFPAGSGFRYFYLRKDLRV